jgi:YbgC/YbaW family acyl-CoA thioester hydrolase
MARLQLDFPQPTRYYTDLDVRVTDLNYGGHAGNDSILRFMHEARIRFYRHLGFKDELSFEGSVGQIVTDAAITYRSESFLGDVLTIEVAVADFNKYGFDMCYRITQKASGKEVAIGKTGIVCFDYAKRKVASIPEVLLEKLK